MNISENLWQPRAMELNENGDWEEIPSEQVLPQWMVQALCIEDEDLEFAIVIPYRQEEFRQWLMTTRDINEKSAGDYLRAYESGYDSLYEEIGIDLYKLLESIFDGTTGDSDLTKEDAPALVKIYLDAILAKMDKNEDSYTKAELRAIASYHAFIIDLAGTNDKKYIKEKTSPLPEEEEFISWLETEYKMDFENAGKIASSVRRMNLLIPSLVTDTMTFLDVLRSLPQKSMRENYFKLVSKQKYRIYKNADCSYKTMQNGLTNIRYYLNFLNKNNI